MVSFFLVHFLLFSSVRYKIEIVVLACPILGEFKSQRTYIGGLTPHIVPRVQHFADEFGEPHNVAFAASGDIVEFGEL